MDEEKRKELEKQEQQMKQELYLTPMLDPVRNKDVGKFLVIRLADMGFDDKGQPVKDAIFQSNMSMDEVYGSLMNWMINYPLSKVQGNMNRTLQAISKSQSILLEKVEKKDVDKLIERLERVEKQLADINSVIGEFKNGRE